MRCHQRKTMSVIPGRKVDACRDHIELWTEEFDDDGTTKTRRRWKCKHCSKIWVYSQPDRVGRHLRADLILCKNNGGVGCCHMAPAVVRAEFRKLVLEKSDAKKTEVTRKRVRASSKKKRTRWWST